MHTSYFLQRVLGAFVNQPRHRAFLILHIITATHDIEEEQNYRGSD
jgi:hypothetical protein